MCHPEALLTRVLRAVPEATATGAETDVESEASNLTLFLFDAVFSLPKPRRRVEALVEL